MRARALAVVVAVAVTGCGSATPTVAPPSTPAAVHVAGTLTVPGRTWRSNAAPGDDCYALDDLKAGAQVVLAADTGPTLALGVLAGGKFAAGASTALGAAPGDTPCGFSFDLSQVPVGSGRFFTLTVGGRPAVRLTRADLDKPVVLTD